MSTHTGLEVILVQIIKVENRVTRQIDFIHPVSCIEKGTHQHKNGFNLF